MVEFLPEAADTGQSRHASPLVRRSVVLKAKPFLVNENPNYRFAELARMPETQLVMLTPLRIWQRLPEYIGAYEAVSLAGRFGADPGDYEWEWIPNPEAVRWWRRNQDGYESLFGMCVGVRRKDVVELYGMVDVDENSPFWAEVIPEEAANPLPVQAKLIARERRRREEDVLAELYRQYFRDRAMLTSDSPGEPSTRRGTIREVERFQAALTALFERASKTSLPSELNTQTR
jgi:hypothetical protein